MSETNPTKRVFSLRSVHIQERQVGTTQKYIFMLLVKDQIGYECQKYQKKEKREKNHRIPSTLVQSKIIL